MKMAVILTDLVMAQTQAPPDLRPWAADIVESSLDDIRAGHPAACRDMDEIVRMTSWLVRSHMGLCPFEVDAGAVPDQK